MKLDYGISIKVGENNNYMAKSLIGTIEYMSPEQLHRNAKYDSKVDIWSLGIIYDQLIHGSGYFMI